MHRLLLDAENLSNIVLYCFNTNFRWNAFTINMNIGSLQQGNVVY